MQCQSGQAVIAEVIVSTYENSAALDLCLAALSVQDAKAFAVCVADDGSDSATRETLGRWRAAFGEGRLRHVWKPHHGFGKNAALNLAVSSSSAEYLIFIDGDCLASPGFVSRHLVARRKGRFLSGGVIRLTRQASVGVRTDMVLSGRVFGPDWLVENGCLSSLRGRLKSGLLPRPLATLLELVSPVKRTWNGGNASGWRHDLIAVNGFDESLGYGGEDVELGHRLNRYGVRGKLLRYTTLLLHLEHDRRYRDSDAYQENLSRVRAMKAAGASWTPDGIRKGAP